MPKVSQTEQVLNFIDTLQKPAKVKTTRLISALKMYGHLLRMPYTKQIDINLYELRTRGDQEIRILYSFKAGEICLLHGYIKKTEKTPAKEIETAKKLKNQLETI